MDFVAVVLAGGFGTPQNKVLSFERVVSRN